MTKKPLSGIAMFVVASLLAAGCVSVLPKAAPAPARYLMAPAEFAGETGPKVEWSLAVEDPQSTSVYDTSKIALIREPGQVEYYASGEWADRGPRLVQAAIIRSFENSGGILSVGDRPSLPVSNFVLQTDIRMLHAAYNGGTPTATVVIFARLTNARGRVYAAHLFRQEVAAAGATERQIVAAFNEAMTAMLKEMVDWTFAEADAVYAK
jgi:cholesterol transport system auxiliary component